MNAKQFFELVESMRHYQREYFAKRHPRDLKKAQSLEQTVDFEIARTRRIVGPRKDPISMIRLFNDNEQ